MAAFFDNVELAPPVEVFALVAAYNEDNHAEKVNLGIGGICLVACVNHSCYLFCFRLSSVVIGNTSLKPQGLFY